MEVVGNYMNIFITHVFSPKGAATILLFLALYLKLYINNKAGAIDFKKMMVSVPGEIVLLLLGFHMSAMIAGDIEPINYIVWTMILFLALAFEYKSDRQCQDKIAGDLPKKTWVRIIIMYAIALLLYYAVVIGGGVGA